MLHIYIGVGGWLNIAQSNYSITTPKGYYYLCVSCFAEIHKFATQKISTIERKSC